MPVNSKPFKRTLKTFGQEENKEIMNVTMGTSPMIRIIRKRAGAIFALMFLVSVFSTNTVFAFFTDAINIYQAHRAEQKKKLIIQICIIGGVALAVLTPIGLYYDFTRKCPNCGRRINYKAMICEYCHKDFRVGLGRQGNTEMPVRKAVAARQMVRVECPNCSNKFSMPADSSATTCPSCETTLEIG